MICPSCASPCSERVIIQVNDAPNGLLGYYFCHTCELIFHTKALPDDFYQADYRRTVSGDECVTEEIIDEQKKRAYWLMPYIMGIHQQVPLRKVLDIGSSTGILLEDIKTLGVEVVGVEPGNEYANYARQKGLSIHERLDLAGDGYDLTTMVHVLEHIPQPVPFLEQVSKISKFLLIEVPNVITHRGACRAVHPLAFSERSLYNLLTNSGWGVDWIIEHWGIHPMFKRPLYLLALAHVEKIDRLVTVMNSIMMAWN